MSEQDYTLWANSDFTIAQCRDCAIPGYLIVSPVPMTDSLSGLGSTRAAQLGLVLVRATSAIEQIIQPLKLYCAQFGEAARQLHFHVFPRTQAITHAYLIEYPEQQDLIHGPVLLDWARQRYKNTRLSTRSWEQIERIRDRLHKIIVEPAVIMDRETGAGRCDV